MIFEALKVKVVCQEEKTTTLASPSHVSVQLAWSLHNKVNSNKIVLIYLSTLKNVYCFSTFCEMLRSERNILSDCVCVCGQPDKVRQQARFRISSQ